LRLLIIDNYDSFTYNLIQLVEQAGVKQYVIVKNDELLKLAGSDFDRVIISPGPGIAKESGDLMRFIRDHYKTKPMLGICLGHEAIAELFGSKLVPMSEPMHGIKNKGTVVVQDSIFIGLPNSFSIGHYHSWNIDEETLPEDLEVIMRDENNLNMAIRHVSYRLVGLQFHPESVMTDYGQEMINNWLYIE